MRRERVQGRRRPRIDLHDARDFRGRRAPIYGHSECRVAVLESRVRVVADGGIRYSGDLVKALAAGRTW